MVVLHPVIGLPVASAGLAGLWYGQRKVVALLASLIGGVMAGLVAYGTAYVVLFPVVGIDLHPSAPYVYVASLVASLLLVGPGAAGLIRNSSPQWTLAVVLAGLSALQVAVLALFATGAGTTVAGMLMSALAEVAAQTGVAVEMESAVVATWPALLVSINGLAALVVTVVVGRTGARRGVSVRSLPALASLDLDPRFAIVPIAAVAALAAGRLIGEAGSVLSDVGINLLIVARWLFFVQGVAVFAGLYERAGFTRVTRALGYALLGVTEVLMPLVSLAGLADVWLNIRRLPRDGASGNGVETPPDTH
jgi:hypothetical protein